MALIGDIRDRVRQGFQDMGNILPLGQQAQPTPQPETVSPLASNVNTVEPPKPLAGTSPTVIDEPSITPIGGGKPNLASQPQVMTADKPQTQVQEVSPVKTVKPPETKTQEVSPVKTMKKPETQVIEFTPQQTPVDYSKSIDTLSDRMIELTDPNGPGFQAIEREFNNFVNSVGAADASQMDLLKQRIRQSGQEGSGAGNAMIASLMRDQNFNRDQVIGKLSVKNAQLIHDMNKWGFEQGVNLFKMREGQKTQRRTELLQAGDIDGYANQFEQDTGIPIDVSELKALSPAQQEATDVNMKLLTEAIKRGDTENAKKAWDRMVELNPKVFGDITFEEYSSGAAENAYLSQAERKETINSQIRLDIGQGDIDDAKLGIRTLFPDEQKRIDRGRTALEGKTLEEVNAILEAAGEPPVNSIEEMIGNEDDFFVASEISRRKDDIESANPIDATVDFYERELKKLGYDITDPEAKFALRSWAIELNSGGNIVIDENGEPQIDPNSILPPWDENSKQRHLYVDWPAMGDEGGEPWGDDNPRPAPDTPLGKYYDRVDSEWEKYSAAGGEKNADEWFTTEFQKEPTDFTLATEYITWAMDHGVSARDITLRLDEMGYDGSKFYNPSDNTLRPVIFEAFDANSEPYVPKEGGDGDGKPNNVPENIEPDPEAPLKIAKDQGVTSGVEAVKLLNEGEALNLIENQDLLTKYQKAGVIYPKVINIDGLRTENDFTNRLSDGDLKAGDLVVIEKDGQRYLIEYSFVASDRRTRGAFKTDTERRIEIYGKPLSWAGVDSTSMGAVGAKPVLTSNYRDVG